VRSERMLMEQLQYNMLFHWFVGLNMDDEVWNATTFSKNRDRLLRREIAEEFFAAVLELVRTKELLSDEHSTNFNCITTQPGIGRASDPWA
jgi:transposase